MQARENRAELRRLSRARKKLLDAALSYAARGWHVFPVHGVITLIEDDQRTFKCACLRTDCGSPAKHPAAQFAPHGFKDATVDPARITEWLAAGVHLGVAIATEPSGLVVVDIDPSKGGERTWADIVSRLGKEIEHTPQVVTGGAGRHLYYGRPEGVTIRSSVNALGPGVDIRAAGGYVVAPPSEHIAGRQYDWRENFSLDQVPIAELPAGLVTSLNQPQPARHDEETGFDLLRALSGVPQGERNSQLFKAACSFRASNTVKKLALQACLDAAAKCDPPFPAAEAATIVERVYRRYPAGKAAAQGGQAVQPVQLLIELVRAQAILFHDGSEPYVGFRVDGREITLRLRTQDFDRWSAKLFYQLKGKGIARESISSARLTLEQMALEGPEERVHLRVAESGDGRIFFDLADAEGNIVEVTRDDWQTIKQKDSPVRFRRTPAMLACPRPEHGGSIQELCRFLNCEPTGFILLCAWLVATFRPRHPHTILILNGEQGTGKSTAATVLRLSADPTNAALRALPRDLRDLAIAADQSHILSFDNLSHVPADVSDAFCRLSTGGAFAVRRLYTDRDQELFEALRPLILTGIAELATRDDFLDRSIILELSRISEQSLRDEHEFYAAFDAARPRILGALLDGVACALRNVDTVTLSRKPRMLDFARWAAAAMPAFGFTADEFISAYVANRRAARALSVETSAIGPLIVTVAAKAAESDPSQGALAQWTGTAGELLTEIYYLADDRTKHRRDFPSRPVALANALRRLAPALRDAGVLVEFSRDHSGRKITLSMKDGATVATKPILNADF